MQFSREIIKPLRPNFCTNWKAVIQMSSRKIRCTISFAILILLTVFVLCMNIFIGSADIQFSDVMKIIFSDSANDTAANILLKIRIPRALAAMILGGSLALSGYLLQTFFHNPIAGPFVLGVSSGAKLTVALVMIFAASRFLTINSAVMIIAAFVGSLLSLGFVLAVSHKVQRMSMLVVCGVMIWNRSNDGCLCIP